MRRGWPVVALGVALAATACAGDESPPATTVAPTTSEAAGPASSAADMTTTSRPGDPCAVRGQHPPTDPVSANYPTAIAFAPDGRLFFAERSGTVRVVQDGEARLFARVSTVTTEPGGGYSERGLLGLAISPTFVQDHFVYAFVSNPNRTTQEIVRWADCAGTAGEMATVVQLPAGSDCCHKGGRIAFGPDGNLYVTLGDEHSAAAAQDTSDPRGKVLRYRPDGTVPPDNPFGAGNPVWAFGFRNPFGLAVSASGQVGVTVNGPTGDAGSPGTGYDTVVASVAKGGGYQWPNCYGYSHPLRSSGCGDGQLEPDWSSEASTVVPTGAAFVNDSGPAPYAGHLVFCTLSGGMRILTPGTPHATVAPGPAGCQLDVKQAPDNALYVADTTGISRLG